MRRWVLALGLAAACARPSAPVAPLPRGMAGTFHLPAQVDAINLELSETGWRATLCGCDSSREVIGSVTVQDGGVRLGPRSGETAFRWLGVGWQSPEVREIELSLVVDGGLLVRGQDGEKKFEQLMVRGRICAVCNPDKFPGFVSRHGAGAIMLGPHGLHACEGPVPEDVCSLK